MSCIYVLGWRFLNTVVASNLKQVRQQILFKQKNLLPILKINICILIYDILRCLEQIKALYFRSTPIMTINEITNNQTIFFQQKIEELRELEIYQDIRLEAFQAQIQFLINQANSNSSNAQISVYNCWLQLNKAKKIHHLDQYETCKLEQSPRLIQSIASFWDDYYLYHRRHQELIAGLAKIQKEKFSQKNQNQCIINKKGAYKDIFAAYKNYFRSLATSLIKSKQKQNCLLFAILRQQFSLIGDTWMKIDGLAASQAFFEQFSFFSQELSQQEMATFYKENKQCFSLIIERIVRNSLKIYKENLLSHELQKQILELKKKLQQISQSQSIQQIITNYAEKINQKIRLLHLEQNLEFTKKKQVKPIIMLHKDYDLPTYLEHYAGTLLQNYTYQKYKKKTAESPDCLKMIRNLAKTYGVKNDFKTKQQYAVNLLQKFIKESKIKLPRNHLKLVQELISGLQDNVQKQLLELTRHILKISTPIISTVLPIKESSIRIKTLETDNSFVLSYRQILSEDIVTFDKISRKLDEKLLQFMHSKICDQVNKTKQSYEEQLNIKITLEKHINYLMELQKIQAGAVEASQLFQKENYFQGWVKFKKFKHNKQLVDYFSRYPYKNCTIRIAIDILALKNKNDSNQSLYKKFARNNNNWIQQIDKQKIRKLIKALQVLQQLEQKINSKKKEEDRKERQKKIQQQFQLAVARSTSYEQIQQQYQNVKFNLISQKLKILNKTRNKVGQKVYTVKLDNDLQHKNFYRKIIKLNQLNKSIKCQSKGQFSIQIVVEQYQQRFESYPQLIKHLIKQYLEIVNFCRDKLDSKFYPLLHIQNLKIQNSQQHQGCYIHTLNPYEGIILLLLAPQTQQRFLAYYTYPCFPFIHLADIINKKMENKVMLKKGTAEFYEFQHLIEEMKALSMEVKSNNEDLVKRILKCPYFWSANDKLFEIVEFKERYNCMISSEELRRKKNISADKLNFEDFGYQKAKDFHRTAQVYFSIEGILQRQAYLQNIHNHSNLKKLSLQTSDQNYQGHKYSFQKYFWIQKQNKQKQKEEIKKMLRIQAINDVNRRGLDLEGEMREKAIQDSIFKVTFQSFQFHIKNLRNFSVHFLYDSDSDNRHEYDSQEKVKVFQRCYPKLFVFLYRWKPFVSKNLKNQIIRQKAQFLENQLFSSTKQIINQLSKVRQLKPYNIINKVNADQTTFLLKLFNYSQDRISSPQDEANLTTNNPSENKQTKNGCRACGIIYGALKRQKTFWQFLYDVHTNNYNVFEFVHQKKGCNGYLNLKAAFANTVYRGNRDQPKKHQANTETTIQAQKDSDQQPSMSSSRIRYQKKKSYIDTRQLTEQNLQKLMYQTDFVYTGFIYQLESQFPFLFHDLRRYRYLWDPRAQKLPQNEMQTTR